MEIFESQEWLKSAFDSYLSLQNESFEFITRSAEMHVWLQEAYQYWRSIPSWNATALYNTWSQTFKHIYEQLFGVLLRPYRLIVIAFGELPKFRESTLERSNHSNIYLDFFRLWGEAQSRFLTGFNNAFHKNGSESHNISASINEKTRENSFDISPLNLLKEVSDTEVKSYVESLERFCGNYGDNQFLYPKSLILKIQEVCSDYPRLCSVSQTYETMLYKTWEKSLQKFTIAVTTLPGSIKFNTFLNRYLNILAREYDLLLQSANFVTVQNDFIGLTTRLIDSMRKVIEQHLTMSPLLPFPTRSEMEVFEKSLTIYRRKLSLLERRVMDLETELDTIKSEKPGSNRKIRKAGFCMVEGNGSGHDNKL